jgi:GntR family transcriptional repressor for pyruvate dehydrogenase complex
VSTQPPPLTPAEGRGSAGNDGFEALSLPESPAARIAARINIGEMRPGARLPSERTLAAQLDVSRPALREALHALQSAGLVVSRRKSGWYVTAHSTEAGALSLARWMQLQPVGDIIMIRRILEPEAIRSIPAVRVAELASECTDILASIRRAVRAGRYDEASGLHSQFHLALVQYAPSRLARSLQASMIHACENAQRDIFRTPRAGSHTLAWHQWILDALQNGDIDETARREVEHLLPAFTYPTGGPAPERPRQSERK